MKAALAAETNTGIKHYETKNIDQFDTTLFSIFIML